MKLHVPANFIGYGSLSRSAMVAFAYLIKRQAGRAVDGAKGGWLKLASSFLLGMVLCIEPMVFRKNPIQAISGYWTVYLGLGALIVWLGCAAWLHMRLTKGLRGAVSVRWALNGLAVTTFAVPGVTMFLSDLHSYGTL